MIEELTAEEEQALQETLKGLLQELEESLRESKESTKPVDLGLPIGRLSRMDAIQQKKMAEANRQNTQVRLQQVRAALQAAERGEYGYCRQCEGPIGYPRLRARPETPFCLECQSRKERR